VTRLVLDTSVVVAAVISPTGPNGQIIELIRRGLVKPYASAVLFEEYARVFGHSHLAHLKRGRIANLLRLLRRTVTMVKPGGKLRISGHDADNHVYACAAAAHAHFIVTENLKHFPAGHKYTKIVTARQLLRLLAN
jgi:putative PIN family toxin of toxin-antitoxin system